MAHQKLTANTFLKDVESHVLTVLRDDDLYRHVRIARPNTGVMRFDLITWPGSLCYTGDMGTYVFSRLPDMFEFFRRDGDKLEINESYWAQKVDAMDRRDQVTQYSAEKFKSQVEWWIKSADLPRKQDRAVRQAIRDEVFIYADDGEYAARKAAGDFSHEGFCLQDFWEANCHEYSYRFVWCLYAIVHGISRYDALKAVKAA